MLPQKVMASIDDALEFIIPELTYKGGTFAGTDSIIHAISAYTNTNIYFKYASFSNYLPKFADSGAVMCVMMASNEMCHAHIVLNQEKDLKFRRFALVHELAHLAMGEYTLAEKDDQYMVCSHIQYDVRPFTYELCQRDSFLETEAMCNAFALKILLPTEKFAEKMFELKDISAVAKCFGVTEEAVCSRALLGQ